jgi:hypothetical protein
MVKHLPEQLWLLDNMLIFPLGISLRQNVNIIITCVTVRVILPPTKHSKVVGVGTIILTNNCPNVESL